MPNNKDNMSLNDVMGNKSSGVTNTNHIDLTRGGINTTETNEQPQQPVARKARPVVTGPIDFNTMKDADIDKILPRRQPKPSEQEEELMSALDMAVTREKQSITERIDSIVEVQDKEIEEAELAKEDAEMFDDEPVASANANGIRSENINMVTEDTDYYDDDEEEYDEDYHAHQNVSKFSVDMEDDQEELVETVMTNPPVKVSHSLDNVQLETEKEQLSATTSNDITANPVLVETSTPTVVSDTKKDEEEFDFIKELGLDDDEELESATEQEEDTSEKILESIKTQVKERVDNVRKSIDLSKFTISKKAVSAQKVMKMAVRAHQSIADWMLYTAERPISVSGLSGSEILKLNPENTTRNRLNTFKDIYRIIFDHVIDANKPEFEAWLKTTNFVDLQHIYFALYMATFGNSNFVNLECPKCKKIFIKDFKIEEMIEYANEETRAKVKNILRKDTTSSKKEEYDVDIVQISNTYAFAIKTPSIWNVIIETASLNDRVLERYADLIDVVSYIDTIYVINESTSELVPIDYKVDPNDQAKTAARRVKAFYDVISSLSSEDYFYLRNVITEYDKNSDDVKYIIPAATCPDCGAEIPANKDITADGLVFTRHQLAAVANM